MMAMLSDQLSPVHFSQSALNAKKAVLNGMEIALSYAEADSEQQRMKTFGICDVSAFSRVGIKGAQASLWLASKGLTVPATQNTWVADQSDGLILRLGRSEFLIEGYSPRFIQPGAKHDAVYEVARYDAAFILSGDQVQQALSEICALDLSARALGHDAVMMTSVAGVSVTLIRQALNGAQVYRLWCDGSYGGYMWRTLTEIAEALGGGAVGLDVHFKQVL